MQANPKALSTANELGRLSEQAVEKLRSFIARIAVYSLGVYDHSPHYDTILDKPPALRRKEFVRFAEEYNTKSWKGVTEAMLDWLAEESVTTRVAVDVGCGPGLSSEVMLRRLQLEELEELVLVDKVPEALQVAQERLESLTGIPSISISYKVASVENLGSVVKAGSADLLVMRAVLRYVEPHEHARVFRECFTALRPGGALLADVPYVSPDRQLHDAALIQALRKALGEEFGIKDFSEAAAFPLVEAPASAAFARLQEAGFPTVKDRNFISMLDSEKVRKYIGNYIQMALIAIKELNSERDLHILEERTNSIAKRMRVALEPAQLHYRSSTGFLAMK